MKISINRLNLLMTHIGYLETQLNEVRAEVKRLEQVAKY